jgi:hypothetical protein
MKPLYDIDDAFEEFMRKANPGVREASVQYAESRRVFMAGIASVFLFLQGTELRAISDEEAEAQLKLIDAQLIDFFKRRVGFNQ